MDITTYFQEMDSQESLFIAGCMLVAFLFGFLIAYLLRSARVRGVRRELRAAEQRLSDAEVELTASRQKLEQAGQDIELLRQEKQEKRNRQDGLERELQEANSKIFSLNKEVEQLRTTNRNYAEAAEQRGQRPDGPQDAAELSGLAAAATPPTGMNVSEQTEERLAAFEVKLDRLEAENQLLREQLHSLGDRTAPPTTTAVPASGPSDYAEPGTVAINPGKEAYEGRILVDERERDDLTRINGLGPFLEQELNKIGVFTYAEMATWDQTRIQQVTAQIGYLPGRIERDNWVGQAQLLAKNVPASRTIGNSLPPSEQPASGDFRNDFGRPFNLDPTDLKVIEGIDAEVEVALQDAGVRSWADLASREVDELRAMLSQADAGLHNRDPRSWSLQARLASEGRWDELRQYQRELNK